MTESTYFEREEIDKKSIFSLQSIDLLYLHKYFYGGVTTFTVHLFYNMRLDPNNKPVLHFSIRNEKKLRDFGYGIKYKNINFDHLLDKKDVLITVIKDNFFHVISELEEKNQRTLKLKNKFLVIHDHRDISTRMIPYLKKWNLITIRKTMQDYLKQRYDLESTFLYHPFYPYPTSGESNLDKKGTVSISRIGYGKNIDTLINANKKLGQKCIDIYGCITPKYVYLTFGKDNTDFKNSYHGKFKKSFFTISKLLSKYKFVVDLSLIKYDGGGTQYTFLEAIHNGCALILHRKWIEDIYRYYKKDYCDFKEGYNCFAVDNSDELTELIRKDPETSNIVKNSKKLLERHITIDWLSSLSNKAKTIYN
jgi:glycosyltransferase involved in cell wall biosynthesis